MLYRPLYANRAAEDLEGLDVQVKQRILDKIDFFCSQSNPLLYAQKLQGFGGNKYRFRIGDYRAIFRIDNNGKVIILVILTVRHRREVYN